MVGPGQMFQNRVQAGIDRRRQEAVQIQGVEAVAQAGNGLAYGIVDARRDEARVSH